jgi:transcriptional regulator with XRE-family HTH domain
MDIGSRITLLRKQQKISQDELAKLAGVSRTMMGNYERNSSPPSVEVLVKLAKAFGVSIDYLIGESDLSNLDKENIKRIEDIEKLNNEDKAHILYAIDNLIKAAKFKTL